uniref:Uncharacterized protein n=1 Tax=Acrobeloides nanus TaxID=290746 RepID=A0A914C4K3_9BILA
MCLLEGFIGILINLPTIYKNVFILTIQEFDGSSFHLLLIKFYVIIIILKEIINYYAIVFDCIITLLVLKSYRRTILNVLISPYKMYKIHWKKTPTSSNRSLFIRTSAITRN